MSDDRTLERAAQAWIEGGPTRAPEHAVEAALAAIRSTPQDRVLVPWRFTPMTAPVRLGALAGLGAIALVAVFVVAGGFGGRLPDTGPGVGSPTAPSTAAPSPSEAPATPTPTPSAAAVMTFTTSSEPRLSIDLPSGWLALETGGEIRLSYLAPDLSSSSVKLVRLDRAMIIEPWGGTAPIPDDLLEWIATNEFLGVESRTEVSIAGRDVPVVTVTGESGGEGEPFFLEHSILTTGADKELLVATAQPAWFALIDHLAVGVLVHLTDPDQVAIDRAIAVLQTLRDATP